MINHIRPWSPTKQSFVIKVRPCSSSPPSTIGCLPPTILWARLLTSQLIRPEPPDDSPEIDSRPDKALLLGQSRRGASNVQFVQHGRILAQYQQVQDGLVP